MKLAPRRLCDASQGSPQVRRSLGTMRGRRYCLLITALLALVPASPGVSQEAAGSEAAPVTAEGALYLVRSTLIALHQANDTGNYTVLRDLGAPAFRSMNTSAALGDIFSALRDASLDLTGVALVPPVFTRPATLTDAGLLHLVGEVDAAGTAAVFEMLFQPVEGTWRLFGLSVRPQAAPVDSAGSAASDGRTSE